MSAGAAAKTAAPAAVGLGEQLRAYISVLKLERTFANVMTTGAGFLFASAWLIDWGLLTATIVGTTLGVMSACAVNNLTDRRLDALMPRAQKRALVTHQVSVRSVVVLAVALGVAGGTLLVVYVNWLTALLGLIGYIDYVLLYAWTKRTTPHSTLVGTICGAIPIVAGYTAVTGQFDLTALLLGLVMVFWQMPHFYAIGIFRLADYKAAKLPVWPAVYGLRSTQVWSLVYTALYVVAVLALTAFGGAGWVFGAVIGGLGVWWLMRGISGLHAADATGWARGMFGLSLQILLIMCGVLVAVPLLP